MEKQKNIYDRISKLNGEIQKMMKEQDEQTKGKEQVCYLSNERINDLFEQLNFELDIARKALHKVRFEHAEKEIETHLYPETGFKDKRQTKREYYFITLKPKELKDDEVMRKQFIQDVHSYMKRNFICDGIYTFEQRGETKEDIHGLHAHLLFKRQYVTGKSKGVLCKPSEVEKELHKKFDKYGFIDIKDVDYTQVSKITKYIGGCKEGKDKEKKVANDCVMRELYGLAEQYKTNGCEL